MNRNLFIHVLAAVALLAFAAPAQTVEDASVPSGGIAEARELIRIGRFDEALAILLPLTEGPAVDAEVLFQIGIASVGRAQAPGLPEAQRDALLDGAVEIYGGLLASRPDLVRVRLELARAYFLRGRDGPARRQFELALAADPPAPVVANINRHLAEIRARKRWRGNFGIALAPDTNIGRQSADPTILIGIGGQTLPFTRDDPGEKSGVGLSIWAGVERQEALSPNVRLRFGGNISRREYSGSENDSMALGGFVGPRWLIGQSAEASVLLAARREWQRGSASSRSAGLRLEASRRLSSRLSGQLGASWNERRHDTSTHLDGPVQDLSAGLAWNVSPTLQTTFRAGWGSERPEFENLRNQTRWVSLGARTALPRGFSVSGTLTGRWADYEGPGRAPQNVVDGGDRSDQTATARLSVLKRDLTFRGFSPQLSVSHERRDSNAQQADYRRTWAELSFVRPF